MYTNHLKQSINMRRRDRDCFFIAGPEAFKSNKNWLPLSRKNIRRNISFLFQRQKAITDLLKELL